MTSVPVLSGLCLVGGRVTSKDVYDEAMEGKQGHDPQDQDQVQTLGFCRGRPGSLRRT